MWVLGPNSGPLEVETILLISEPFLQSPEINAYQVVGVL